MAQTVRSNIQRAASDNNKFKSSKWKTTDLLGNETVEENDTLKKKRKQI